MRALYERYTTEVASLAQSGSSDASAIKPLVTQPKFARDQQSIQTFSKSGRHVTGRAQVTNFELQQVDLVGGSGRAYVCVDLSNSKVRTKSGRDVTATDRPDRQALVVGFVRGPLIDTSDVWAGTGVC